MENISIEQKLKEFSAPLFNSTILTSDRAIASFLQSVVATPELFSVVKEVSSGFNYNAELRILTFDKKKIHIPQNKKTLVALVTKLLYDFNRNEKNILDFVMANFDGSSCPKCYEMFINELIAPYIEAFSRLATGDIAKEEITPEETIEAVPFSDTVAEESRRYLDSISAKLDGTSLDNQSKKEILTAINGMEYVLDTKNILLISLSFVALKNSVLLYKIEAPEIDGLQDLFTTFGIL